MAHTLQLYYPSVVKIIELINYLLCFGVVFWVSFKKIDCAFNFTNFPNKAFQSLMKLYLLSFLCAYLY